jgi:carboxymethylenebutenolidase
MSRQDVTITMPDGEARAYVFTPDKGDGPWPVAIFYTDAIGIRPTVFDMGERLASHGYTVLMPDLFWRLGAYEPVAPMEFFTNRETMMKFVTSTSAEKAMADTGVWLDWIAKHPKAKPGKVGVNGYCMGGKLALTAAGTYPDRIAAVGAFHAAGVATDAPDSPHLLADKIKAKVLVAGADEDNGFDQAQCERLSKALKDAGVDAEVGIWTGKKHGYAPPDMPVYDKDASERHWKELVALYDETLKQPATA